MPLQPGPFLQLSAADVGVEPGVYDFTDDALVLEAELNDIAAGWDSFFLDAGNFAAEPWDVELATDLDGILGEVISISASLPGPNMDSAFDGWFTAQDMLTAATAFAPAQAFLGDPGEAFTPPDTSTIAVPTINPNIYAPAPNQTIGTAVSGPGPSVALLNTTRVGTQSFTVGDKFWVLINGSPGQDVSVNSTLNGQDLPPVDYGPIDNTGQMNITGTIGPESVGGWSEQWFIEGNLFGSFNFIVSPSGE